MAVRHSLVDASGDLHVLTLAARSPAIGSLPGPNLYRLLNRSGRARSWLTFGGPPPKSLSDNFLFWIVVKPDDSGRAEEFAWRGVEHLINVYEDAAEHLLEAIERRA
jgi:hypothetical protein